MRHITQTTKTLFKKLSIILEEKYEALLNIEFAPGHGASLAISSGNWKKT
jgi:hypothetical protein